MIGSLYLHVPFCPQVCPYCDFHKMLRHEGLVDSYLTRLEQEIEERSREWPGRLDTVYFGGGTPTALNDDELGRVVRALDRAWGFPAHLETTIEVDPLTFDRQRLERLRDFGFSRLSLGLQSTQDAVLRRLGRRHSGREGLEALDWALESGMDVSVDIMTAVPQQDPRQDLQAVGERGVDHVSVYTLTIEPNTPFARRGVKVDEERAADDYELAAEVLAKYGLERYEVSSHARPGFESRHNQVYWHGDFFLGIGPSAAGFLPAPGSLGRRVNNQPIKRWLGGEPPEEERVSAQDYVLERLMTGLRTRSGVDLADVYERTGIDVSERFRPSVDPLIERGLLELDGERLRATPGGLMLLDSILRRFFAASELAA